MNTVAETQVMPDVPTYPPIDSFTAADDALLMLGRVEALITKAEASLNTKIQKLREEYELNTRTHIDFKEQLEIGLQEFCDENKHEFANKRTIELTHGTIGFRRSPAKLLTVSKKFTWKIILELLIKSKWGTGFIRTKSEVDKEAIHTAYAAKELTDKQLEKVGMKIDQDDEFVCDIKWESIQ